MAAMSDEELEFVLLSLGEQVRTRTGPLEDVLDELAVDGRRPTKEAVERVFREVARLGYVQEPGGSCFSAVLDPRYIEKTGRATDRTLEVCNMQDGSRRLKEICATCLWRQKWGPKRRRSWNWVRDNLPLAVLTAVLATLATCAVRGDPAPSPNPAPPTTAP